MPLSRRYVPEHPPDERCVFAMDFAAVIPPGVGIADGRLTIQTNTVPPGSDGSWVTIGPVEVRGRVLFATLQGGVSGTDYQFVWTATDTDGNVFPRTALCLCAPTS